jgi:sugar phosphate isomerase/epimerase
LKLLMFYAPSFWFKPFEKTLEDVPAYHGEKKVENAVVVFYHGEAEDVERRKKVITKALKNIKWLAGKFGTKTVVLHSFGHLSTSKAPPEFTAELIQEVIERLTNTAYEVHTTPFGYLNEWKIHVAGESLAKVFKDI